MLRKVVKIDESKCNGCGQCVPNCAEGALKVIDGKARLVSEVYCDGLGACLGTCPQDAITVEEREAQEFDEEVVKAAGKGAEHEAHEAAGTAAHAGGRAHERHAAGAHEHVCPGAATMVMGDRARPGGGLDEPSQGAAPSALSHWPVQIRLVSPNAPFLKGAHLLVCADCVPFAVGDFHKRYLEGRTVLVGCPKLDDLEGYREKLTEIIENAGPASITVLRMEVPCCGGLASAVIEARDRARPDLPVTVEIVGIRGDIRRELFQ